jgi:hypothetical protein
MFARIVEFLEKRRAKNFLNDLRLWYDISGEVSDLLGEALYDEQICSSEIGLVLDKTDQLLFTLGGAIPGAQSGVYRHDPGLAHRLEQVSTNIYRLRNATVSFLVRCHGAGIYVDRAQEGLLARDYYLALEEAGFSARQIHREVERELKAISRELQRSIRLAELAAA